MKTKRFLAPMSFKAEGTDGEFQAVFASLSVVDHDGDVTLPGAFTDGEAVRISHWSHGWDELPVGKGTIHEEEDQAIVDGKFFLDTEAGREHYLTVRNLAELQEWSYGFDILEESFGEFEGQKVRFLRKLKVYEVSPVMLGAGIGTHTTDVKAWEETLDALVSTTVLGQRIVQSERMQKIHDMALELAALCDDSGGGGEGEDQGKAGDGKSRSPGRDTLAARVALELLESGYEDGSQ